jgi:hypothetical protein
MISCEMGTVAITWIFGSDQSTADTSILSDAWLRG